MGAKTQVYYSAEEFQIIYPDTTFSRECNNGAQLPTLSVESA